MNKKNAEDCLSTMVYVQVLNCYVHFLQDFPLSAGDSLYRQHPRDGATLFQFYIHSWGMRQEQARFLMEIQRVMSREDALYSYIWYTGPAQRREAVS